MTRTLLTFLLLVVLQLSAGGQEQTRTTPMDDQTQIRELYERMYRAMVAKDINTLDLLHSDDFTLTHITGMKQSKHAYLEAIQRGTLNYYTVEHDHTDIHTDGPQATLTGRSRVTAAVFGGGRHTWRLQLRFTLRKENGHWQLTSAVASTY